MDRIDGVISSFKGIPTETIKNHVDDLINKIPEEKSKKRLTKIKKDNIKIFPYIDPILQTPNQYKVITSSKNKNSSEYYIDDEGENISCTCYDFYFRGDPSKNIVCKHIWKLRILRNMNILPKNVENIENWLIKEINNDKKVIEDTNLKEKLNQEKTKILEEELWEIDEICKQRSQIFSEYKNKSE